MALRFFHTADWHLGQQFHGFDRDAEHARFLDWLLGQLVDRSPDALVVSGDVFDSISPPASAQRRQRAGHHTGAGQAVEHHVSSAELRDL